MSHFDFPERPFFEQMEQSIAIYDREARFVYANPRLLARMGTSMEAVRGRSLWEVYPEARDNDFSRALRRALESRTKVQQEHYYEPWDSWFDNRFYPHESGVCVVAHDITAQKRAEQRALALESERAELLESLPAAVAVVRAPEWVYELSNAQNDALGGRGPLLGKRVAEVLPELAAQGYLSLLERVRETGEPFVGNQVRVVVEAPDGPREMFLNGVYQPLRGPRGELDRVMAFAYDVTEEVRATLRLQELARQLAESEARARRLSDSGVIGVIFWTRDGRLVDANDAFLRMVGYTREELSSGQVRWKDMTPPEFAWLDERAFAEMDVAGICTPFEKEYFAKDGRRVPILLGVAFWEGSRDSGVAWILDVTGRRATEAERDRLLESERRARAEAEAANLSKDQFLAMVSHELRTPLNAMLGWGRLLKAGTLDAARRERALDVIERNALAQAQLIEELLDISRIVSGKLNLEVAPYDIKSAVEAAVDTVRPALESKRMSLRLIMPAHVEPTFGDAHRVQQVVWNLLSNAVKFTPQGGNVDLSLEQDTAETVLRVSDDGPGIPAAALPFVFESFRQADSSITRAFGGLGLGLSISRHLVELHGGSIAAFSDGEGRGATFVVRLPLGADGTRSDAAQPSRPRTTPTARSLTQLSGLNVLVVDDEPDARELIATILTEVGALVVTTASTESALELLSVQRFDVLVSDIGMPGQDGYALMRAVREHPALHVRGIPAAALTAYARSEDHARAITTGYQLHLSKPVDPTNLVEVVGSLAKLAEQLRHSE
ncbi:MAG: sensor hybrid histidine kinase [Polyangiaceae bacterium]|nr:sensor hybrid histidine kinase [Polyangiaceae bacterium]